MHNFTFQNALTLLRKQPRAIAFIGVEPAHIDYGLELTSAVQQALPAVVEGVADIVQQWSATPLPSSRAELHSGL